MFDRRHGLFVFETILTGGFDMFVVYTGHIALFRKDGGVSSAVGSPATRRLIGSPTAPTPFITAATLIIAIYTTSPSTHLSHNHLVIAVHPTTRTVQSAKSTIYPPAKTQTRNRQHHLRNYNLLLYTTAIRSGATAKKKQRCGKLCDLAEGQR